MLQGQSCSPGCSLRQPWSCSPRAPGSTETPLRSDRLTGVELWHRPPLMNPGAGLQPKPRTFKEGSRSPAHLQRDAHTGSNVPDDSFSDSCGGVALVAVHFDDRALHKGRHRMMGPRDSQWPWKHPCPGNAVHPQHIRPFSLSWVSPWGWGQSFHGDSPSSEQGRAPGTRLGSQVINIRHVA